MRGIVGVETLTFKAVGLGLLLIIIVIVFYGFAPLFQHIFSPCWGVFVSGVNMLTMTSWETTTRETIKMGDCVGFLAFFNREDLVGFEDRVKKKYDKELNCDRGEENKAYVVGAPYFPETETGWKIWTKEFWKNAPKDVWENVENWWREKAGGVKPVCIGFDKPFEETLVLPKGTYCITLEKQEETYRVTYEEGECKA